MTSVTGSHTPHDCRHTTSFNWWDSETAAWVQNMSPGRLVLRSFWVQRFFTASSQHWQEKVAATHFCCRPFCQKTPWEFHRCRACQASFPSPPPSVFPPFPPAGCVTCSENQMVERSLGRNKLEGRCLWILGPRQKKRRKSARGRGLTSLEEEKQKGEGGGVWEVEGGDESHDAQHLLARKLRNAASQVHFRKKNITNSFLPVFFCNTVVISFLLRRSWRLT